MSESLFIRKAAVGAIYEYFLVTLPVAIYVSLEALEKSSPSYCWSSPEWAIATIFLCFQGLSLYGRELQKTKRRLSVATIGIFTMGAMLLIIVASINAYQSSHDNGIWAMRIRVALFAFASFGFLLFVTSARLVHIRTRGV